MPTSRVFLGLLFGLAIGCTDPERRLKDFLGRVPDAHPVVDAPPGMIADISGSFLVGLSVPLAPDKPVQFLSTNTLTQTGDTAMLDMQLQALSADAARMPVGSPVMVTGVAVAANGTFHADLGTLTIPGAANPIIAGDITAQVQLDGTIQSMDFYCGAVTGMVLMPIPLNLMGSTWAGQRVPPGTMGSALPPPRSTCTQGSMDGGPDAPPADAAADAGADAE